MRSVVTAIFLFVTACAATQDDVASECSGGKCDSATDQACNDPHYGDGVCQLELSCAVPDIDCFETFADDDAAATWYATQETWVATAKGKPQPRKVLPTTDPRYAELRALLDDGWAAFSAHRPVGRLAQSRPALVLVDDPEANAYVIPDQAKGKSAFAVMVQTGILGLHTSDDGRFGLMMHELQHAVGLHLIGAGPDRIRKYYTATDDNEPIGRNQPDTAAVRALAEAWLQGASQVGPHTTAELGGIPFGGELGQVFTAVLRSGQQNNPAGCAPAIQAYDSLTASLTASADPLSGALHADRATLDQINAILVALRDQCLPTFPYSFVDVVASLTGATPAAVTAQMDPSDLALINGRHVIEAIAILTADRRAKMRAAEAGLPYGNPWTNARYFSFEEDADDVSLFALRAAGRQPDALADFLLTAIKSTSAPLADQCAAVLDAGKRPPYGVDLTDQHHSTCWRAYHLRQYASTNTARVAPASDDPAPSMSVSVPARLPFPAPRQLLID